MLTKRFLSQLVLGAGLLLLTEGRLPAPNCPGGCQMTPIHTYGEEHVGHGWYQRLREWVQRLW